MSKATVDVSVNARIVCAQRRGRINRPQFSLIGALITLSLVLSGCAGTGSAWVESKLRPAEGEPLGWLVASIGVKYEPGDSAPFQHNAISFKAQDSDARGSVSLRLSDLTAENTADLDLVADGIWLHASSVALKPGKYRLSGGYMVTDVGTFRQAVSAADDFSFPFEVRDGHVTYLGSYVAHTLTGENRLGMTIRAGAYFVISDQHERDLGFVYTREEAPPKNAPVLLAVPQFSEPAGGLFISADAR